jgi:ABC-type glycerol-3-phosphate transport system substrate-binding protein
MTLVIDKKVRQKAGVEPHAGWTWDEFTRLSRGCPAFTPG